MGARAAWGRATDIRNGIGLAVVVIVVVVVVVVIVAELSSTSA